MKRRLSPKIKLQTLCRECQFITRKLHNYIESNQFTQNQKNPKFSPYTEPVDALWVTLKIDACFLLARAWVSGEDMGENTDFLNPMI